MKSISITTITENDVDGKITTQSFDRDIPSVALPPASADGQSTASASNCCGKSANNKHKKIMFDLPSKCPAIADKITGLFSWRHTYRVQQKQKGLAHTFHKTYSLNLPKKTVIFDCIS